MARGERTGDVAAAPRYLAPRHVFTHRLELRPFTLDDHAAYAAICADAEVMRYVGMGKPNTPEMTWRSMAAMLGHWEMLGYGLWALALRDGPLIGHVGFIDVLGWPGFELGYVLGREHWGNGYAQEAARAALRIAHHDLRKERVISLIRPENAASMRVAQRLGAVREGEVDLMGSAAALFAYPAPPR